MSAFLISVATRAIQTGAVYAACWSVLLALELLFPRERQSALSRFKAATIWTVTLPTAAFTALGVAKLLSFSGLKPLVVLDFGGNWLVATLVGVLVGDFIYYWYHRAMHRWFWTYHAVHHSIRELNSISAYIHPLDDLIHTIFAAVPAAFLFGVHSHTMVGIVFVITLQGHFIHACTRLHLGPLRRIIADNRFHRLHHSIEPAHFDCNFGSAVTLWDQLFGTAKFPLGDEWPATGVADRPEPMGVWHFLKHPFAPNSSAIPNRRAVQPMP